MPHVNKSRKRAGQCRGQECIPPAALQELAEGLDVLFFRALSEPIRLELLRTVMLHGPLDVETAAGHYPQDRSVISRHLAALRDAGLLRARREGRRALYEVNGPGLVARLEDMLQRVRAAVEACCPGQLGRAN